MINDRYKIKKKLGSDKYNIYLCTDIFNPAKDIVIKVLTTDTNEKDLETFRNEFFLLKKLNHPNIVRAYEYGTVVKIEKEEKYESEIALGNKFLTQDYINGNTLDNYAYSVDMNILKLIIEQICSVLYYLHQSNYIYYNLTPENIIIQNRQDSPHVFFYDFRSTKFIPNNEPYEVHGKPHYVAPEILQINKVDHRADLYSLGIIFYTLIYDRFPFETDNELNIYKANIELDFDFPEKPNYETLISVTKDLLHKSPNARYNSSLQILEVLQIPITNKMKNIWNPIKTFCGRKKELYDINSFIYTKRTNEVITIRGEEGSGKTFFLEELNYIHPNSILIKASDNFSNDGIGMWSIILRKIFYSDIIYNNIDNSINNEIKDLLNKDHSRLTEKLKSLFLRISRENKFVIFLDDFNSYDTLSIEILKEIIPILQVSGIKIVITEDSGKPIVSDFIKNLKVMRLHPFNQEDLNEFFDKSFFRLFPKSSLKNFVSQNSNLLPGYISSLVDSLVLLGCIRFEKSSIKICNDFNLIEHGKKNQTDIYKLNIDRLSNDELKIVNMCSLFNINLDIKTISILGDINEESAENIVLSLINKGIFGKDNFNLNSSFVSAGLKKYIYNGIPSKKELHLSVAEKIQSLLPNFSNIECSRQFELAGDYGKCCEILINEINTTAAKSNLNYQLKLLSKIAAFPLNNNVLPEIEFLLVNVLFKLNEFSKCIDLINKLLEAEINEDQTTDLLIQKGKCLIRLSNHDEGISLLNSILPNIKKERITQQVKIEIARANLDLNNFQVADEICKKVIEAKQSTDESKADAYSIIAFIEQIKSNNPAVAIYNYQYAINMYQRAGLPYFVAKTQMIIGNIIYLKGNSVEAEKHWQNAFKTNELIGNLSNEADILFNYGKYYFNKQLFDNAVEQFQRADDIFSSLANEHNRGLASSELGKVYLNICEYDEALIKLEIAKNILEKISDENYATTIFLIAQCYFYLGDTENLEAIINFYDNLCNRNILGDKHQNNIEYLKILLSFCRENYLAVIEKIEGVIEFYRNSTDQEDKLYYTKSQMLLIRSLINRKNYNTAVSILNETNFQKICENNSTLRAEKEFLLGIISEKNEESKLKAEPGYFMRAIKLIENQHILELTWEINYALAIFYFERGDNKKFTEYSLVAKSLINFIAGKIGSKLMRTQYLNSFGRKSFIETLENKEKSI